jgi:hypothetical protein
MEEIKYIKIHVYFNKCTAVAVKTRSLKNDARANTAVTY